MPAEVGDLQLRWIARLTHDDLELSVRGADELVVGRTPFIPESQIARVTLAADCCAAREDLEYLGHRVRAVLADKAQLDERDFAWYVDPERLAIVLRLAFPDILRKLWIHLAKILERLRLERLPLGNVHDHNADLLTEQPRDGGSTGAL